MGHLAVLKFRRSDGKELVSGRDREPEEVGDRAVLQAACRASKGRGEECREGKGGVGKQL